VNPLEAALRRSTAEISKRAAVRLITERGFHRDRDREASLDSLIDGN